MKPLKLIKYGHEHCSPCKLLKPVLVEIAETFKDTLEFVDKDTYQMSPAELLMVGLKAVPTMILSKDGVEIWRHVGLMSKDAITQKITENI
jgi:thioredoxin 1